MRERRARLIFSAVVWVILLSLGLGWTLSSRRVRIAIAGGPAGSESFELASAIARVLQEAVPRLRVDVYETGGTTDDIQLIREARVDMATIQSDAEVDDRVQGVASLYYDAYQLIVREESSVLAFADLRGLRIAVAPTDSGQNRSFWFVARHFGLDADEVIALPMSEAAADFAMIHGQVDAVFRVRTPGNRAIRKLVGKHPMRIVPISQPEALALAQPSVSAGIIPIGSYRGYPPLPPEDLTTAVLERLLVVRADLDSDIVWDLTRVLFERRANLVAATKLAGFIRPLGDAERLPYPIHAGAQLYYNREKPGFVQQNARTLSGMLYVLAVLTSALVALRTRYVRGTQGPHGELQSRVDGHRGRGPPGHIAGRTPRDQGPSCPHTASRGGGP